MSHRKPAPIIFQNHLLKNISPKISTHQDNSNIILLVINCRLACPFEHAISLSLILFCFQVKQNPSPIFLICWNLYCSFLFNNIIFDQTLLFIKLPSVLIKIYNAKHTHTVGPECICTSSFSKVIWCGEIKTPLNYTN